MIEEARRVKRIASDDWRCRLHASGALSTNAGVTNTQGRSATGLTIGGALQTRDRHDDRASTAGSLASSSATPHRAAGAIDAARDRDEDRPVDDAQRNIKNHH
ncbi:hypothetical protein [Burkholderia lata]|uniref:hypothetical protein n=1 Tax=Burkholderia lata (strain ATCC 17760 / DSM 23089 / LMG 22485 / NCIMB 9086 / R18194 / 383) TaxID=482957 RepID=UPI001583414B|nr:hypothetical protein [Burkholderia lata]